MFFFKKEFTIAKERFWNLFLIRPELHKSGLVGVFLCVYSFCHKHNAFSYPRFARRTINVNTKNSTIHANVLR